MDLVDRTSRVATSGALRIRVAAFLPTTLLAIGIAAGQAITEYPTSYQFAGGICAGPDGNVWFTESSNSPNPPNDTSAAAIGRIKPDGTITDFPIPVGSAGNQIVSGPDGNLWFTESWANRIGRLTTQGILTEFPIPAAQSFPSGIAAGPDGNLWFLEENGNNVGRITPAGSVTEFPIPAPVSGVEDITLGPDGNLWFTETTSNNIGRITPGGQVTEFPIATASALPHGIAVGSDGNLWFVEGQGGKIARITPAGVIMEFPLPADMVSPIEITAGPDGNLWITGQFNSVGRATTSGVITEFVLPTPFALGGSITAGPDGNVWFTEQGNAVARVAPAPCGGPTTLCLHSGRFLVQATWEGGAPVSPPARGVRMTDESGYLWFYDAANAEVVVKVIDGCALNGHFWLFGAGMTNVLVNLSVQDAQTGVSKTYTNPWGTPFQPIQDNATFPCP